MTRSLCSDGTIAGTRCADSSDLSRPFLDLKIKWQHVAAKRPPRLLKLRRGSTLLKPGSIAKRAGAQPSKWGLWAPQRCRILGV